MLIRDARNDDWAQIWPFFVRIVREGETLVFVEVRGRSDTRLGHPFETVDARKQARLRRGAMAWLVANDLWERVATRFDVIALVGDDDPNLEWLRDAF